MINIGKEWRWMEDKKTNRMIYRNIEKLILETPNDMELGKKVRERYLKEVQGMDFTVYSTSTEQWDEDHALDQVLNKMVEDLEEEDKDSKIERLEETLDNVLDDMVKDLEEE